MSLMMPLCRQTIALLLMCLSSVFVSSAYANDAPTPAYIELKPIFIVNHLSEGSQLKYIKTSISIRTDETRVDLIEHNMPLVRDAIVMFLSARTTDQVSGAIAREQTREDAANAVNEALKTETGITPVKDILFASFVTQ
ncbi:flagellar basal body-associated FliL family protein [Marinomonas aquiplantarum]|uniref:Flagellar protein FliL n=1 Tax=Marinomonas aquiplantarum TaxID=491951 RepID=A0A366D6Y0_9GAMM|nr:flagellar basal body-associated FliL family protein [Marinomonas aquiplantarum]RBO85800.1 flagellar FliL protein [Marinomonas aquiplantarum]